MECENKYENGKIYKIVDNTNGDIYIGSTIQTLKKRLHAHKTSFRLYNENKINSTTNSHFILLNGDYKIELLEKYPCNSKKKLEIKEREYIENNVCINKCIPTRTSKEYYRDNLEKIKKYREENKEKAKLYKKEHYLKNKIEHNKRTKQYRIDNREQILQKEKQFREENKEKLKQRSQSKITCECGQIVNYGHYARHKKSQKHINYINSL